MIIPTQPGLSFGRDQPIFSKLLIAIAGNSSVTFRIQGLDHMRRMPIESRYVDVRAAPAAVDEQRQLILRVAHRVPSADDFRHVELLPAELADVHHEGRHHLQVLS